MLVVVRRRFALMYRAGLLGIFGVAATAGAALPPPARAARSGTVAAGRAQVAALVASGIDTGERQHDGRIAVVVHAGDRRTLRRLGLRLRPAPKAPRTRARPTLPSGRTTYRGLADYNADLAAMVRRYPRLARPVTIGISVQGRPIHGVEIAQHVRRAPDGRPTHVEMGLHHAREWSSGEVVVEYGLDLLHGYRHNRRITRLVNRERTFLFPVINPDGFVISRTTKPLQRKNADEVDLNRNYGAFWGGPGASDDPASDTFRGPAPFSEPETRAVRDWSTPHQVIVLNTNHNYAGDVLYQPGFSRVDEPGLPSGTILPGSAAFEHVARRMASAAGYVAMPANQLYDVTGATEDFTYFAQGTFGYTTEVGYDDYQPDYQDGVVDQYLGTVHGLLDRAAGRRPSQGLRETFLRAGEAALSPTSHGVIYGSAPPGATLTLSRDEMLSTADVLAGTDTPSPVVGAPQPFPVHLQSTLRVPRSGRFTWAVNPSTPPLAAIAATEQFWDLGCGAQTTQVAVNLGQRRRADLRCATSTTAGSRAR